jgi:hypothetical protein
MRLAYLLLFFFLLTCCPVARLEEVCNPKLTIFPLKGGFLGPSGLSFPFMLKMNERTPIQALQGPCNFIV